MFDKDQQNTSYTRLNLLLRPADVVILRALHAHLQNDTLKRLSDSQVMRQALHNYATSEGVTCK